MARDGGADAGDQRLEVGGLGERRQAEVALGDLQLRQVGQRAEHLELAVPLDGRAQLALVPRPADAVYRTACKRVGGYIPAPEAVGIGVTLDEEMLGKAEPHYMPTQSLVRIDGSPALAV